MFTRKGQLVRYREGTEFAGEVTVVAEPQYSPNSKVRLLCDSEIGFVWANPSDLESAE